MSFCRIPSTDCDMIKVIGRSLHNLEQLYLELKNDNFDAIECLVTGCPKLKILHVLRGLTLNSAQHVLLGLPNLIEFKHPLMAVALEKIIQDGRADRVSTLRTLYMDQSDYIKFGVRSVYKSAQVVINHLTNITKLNITVPYEYCKESLKNLSRIVSTMSYLTELTWHEFSCSDAIVPIIKALGHHLRLLNLLGADYSCLDVIDQCRELRVLRIVDTWQHSQSNIDPNYGSDLQEHFSPFQHLQELELTGLIHSHVKSALLKSLISSPVLQDLKLQWFTIFTDNIVKSAFTYINDEGEQLAFTSLRKLELWRCDFITKYLENVVTHERVPLEMLTINGCSGLTERHLWNMERFDLKFIDSKNTDDYDDHELYWTALIAVRRSSTKTF